MIYLLAKYTLLFLLASLLGFVLGYWWSRRGSVDVTESFETMRQASQRSDAADWSRLWQRLDDMPQPEAPDFSPVNARIDKVAAAVAAIPAPEPARDVDLSPVLAEIGGLRKTVAGLPVVETNPPTDLTPLEKRLAALKDAVASIPRPAEPKPVDLGGINRRVEELASVVAKIPRPAEPKPVDLGGVNRRLEELARAVANIPRPAEPKEVDLSDVREGLDRLRRQIERLPAVETHPPADLTPLTARVEQLERRIAALPRPDRVDMAPIQKKLDSIDERVRSLRIRPTTPVRRREPSTPAKKSDKPVILSAALYGNKDDLKRISGVGPKLERLLNENGVYYFWQVASWSKKDVDFIDDRLDVFRGRILRDDWVRQARSLKSQPGAARMPADV